jgi:hypothetical protein
MGAFISAILAFMMGGRGFGWDFRRGFGWDFWGWYRIQAPEKNLVVGIL